MKKIVYISAFLMILSLASFAQDDVKSNDYDIPPKDIFVGSWEIAFPIRSDLSSETSFSGGRFEYRRMLPSNFSIGLGVSWHSFEQYKPEATYVYPTGDGAITTDLVAYVYSTDLTANGHYYFNISRVFKPYVGLGIGAEYTEQHLFFNLFEIKDTAWDFLVRPEVGVFVRISPIVSGFVSAAYSYSSTDSYILKYNKFDYIALNIGVALTI